MWWGGARCGTRSRDPGVTPWAEGGAKPLSHPGCPMSPGFKFSRNGTVTSDLPCSGQAASQRSVWLGHSGLAVCSPREGSGGVAQGRRGCKSGRRRRTPPGGAGQAEESLLGAPGSLWAPLTPRLPSYSPRVHPGSCGPCWGPAGGSPRRAGVWAAAGSGRAAGWLRRPRSGRCWGGGAGGSAHGGGRQQLAQPVEGTPRRREWGDIPQGPGAQGRVCTGGSDLIDVFEVAPQACGQ